MVEDTILKKSYVTIYNINAYVYTIFVYFMIYKDIKYNHLDYHILYTLIYVNKKKIFKI